MNSLRSINKHPDKICDKLYLSGFYEARQKDILKELGITHILVCGLLTVNFPEVIYIINILGF
jgi:nicotinamidase-related amidase